MDIEERLTAFAMLGAEWVLWLLVALSVFGIAVMLERTYYMLASRDDIDELRNEVRSRLDRKDLEAARRRLAQSRSFEARVASVALDAAADGVDAARERLGGEAKLARLRMERNLAFLGTVGNNAPFVGLLGTVIGVIRAFHSLNESSGQVTAGLMADVGEALVATAIGILVALPAVAAFNAFQRAIKARLGRADALASDILAYLVANPSSAERQPAE